MTAWVLHLGRVQRLLTLEGRGESALEAAIHSITAPPNHDATGAVAAELADGTHFLISLTNQSRDALRIVVLAVDDRFGIELVYPLEESDPDLLRAGRSLRLGAENPFVAAHIGPENAPARVRLIVLAADTPIDPAPLLGPPAAPAPNRGDASASTLHELLQDLAFGSGALRHAHAPRVPGAFASATLIIDISPQD